MLFRVRHLGLGLAFLSLAASAQTARLTGTVVDAVDRQPLLGVNVVLVAQDVGAATTAGGRFDLESVPGTYLLRATLIGYDP